MIPVSSIKLQNHIDEEKKKHMLWAFLASHGSGEGGYYQGYLAALRDIEENMKSGKLDLV
ncbi:hypothetical protein SD70_29635 [Gordoniibacillus kamchatkensis]|uniref:Uncharacterized protein n=1 Tax=Gordoniibacillus kamchatkensis TaxID=1590651 RepID=A0ABR5AB81_9BACL|nr:hypothetical protein [Paenibacillus sp. VKM B-2647]KIL37953.1 hypothetical protein SD70_29635 [Paenibacillus sp. VKM B-2647]